MVRGPSWLSSVWRAIQLAEISLVCAPSNPDCHAWLDTEPLEYLSEGQQVARSKWRAAVAGAKTRARTANHGDRPQIAASARRNEVAIPQCVIDIMQQPWWPRSARVF